LRVGDFYHPPPIKVAEMRRTASEIIRNLQVRIARLEGRIAAPRGMSNLDALDYDFASQRDIFSDEESVSDWLHNTFNLVEESYQNEVDFVSAFANRKTRVITLRGYSKVDAFNTDSLIEVIYKIRVRPDGSYTQRDVQVTHNSDVDQAQYIRATRQSNGRSIPVVVR